MFETILSALMNFFSWVFLYTLNCVMDLFFWFLDQLPDLTKYTNTLTTLISYAAKANVFFPVVEMCILLALVMTFLIGFIALKFILKLIPTIG